MPAAALPPSLATVRRALVATALATALAGCSSNDGTNPRPTPTGMAIVSGNNQTGTVNALLPLPFVVRVEDAAGTDYPGLTITWTVTSGGGTLGNLTSTTDSAGEAKVQYVLGSTPGTNRVEATVENSILGVTFTATAQNPPTDNAPADIFLISGNNQSGPIGAPLADSLVVEVRNAAGKGVGGVALSWTVTTGGGTLGAATTVTSPAGRAANTYAPGAAGTNTVTVTVQTKPTLTLTINSMGT